MRGQALKTTADTHGPRVARGDSYKWLAFAAVGLGQFAGVMDFSAVGVALPTLADDLGLSLPAASWVLLAAALTISAVLLPVGGLSDALGRKRMWVAGGALFALGGVASGLSPSLIPLVMARIVMAIGQAIQVTNGYAIVAVVFPARERGKGIGAFTTVVGVALITGPVIGGALVDAFGWRSVFFMLAAAGGLSALLGAWILDTRRVEVGRERAEGRLDWLGAGLSTAALTLLILAMNNGGQVGWTSPLILGALLGAAVLAPAFVARELTAARPMFDLGMFRSQVFRWASAARYMGFTAYSAWRFLMPFYLQDVQGYGAGRVGLLLLPAALGMTVFSSISGRLSDRYGTKPFVVAGLALVVFAGLLFATLREETPAYLVMAMLLCSGVGLGLFDAPNTASALAGVSERSYSSASAFVNLVRNTGNVTSVAFASAIVSGVVLARGFEPDLSLIGDEQTGRMAAAFMTGARYAYLAPAVVGVLALLAALRASGARADG